MSKKKKKKKKKVVVPKRIQLYRTMLQELPKKWLRDVPASLGLTKKQKEIYLIRNQLLSKEIGAMNGPGGQTCIAESLYSHRGSPSIIIDNLMFLKNLCSSKTDVRLEDIHFPLGGMFSVNMPKDFTYNGQTIPSFMAWYHATDGLQEAVDIFSEEFDFDINLSETISVEPFLSIFATVYVDGEIARMYTNIQAEQIKEALSSESDYWTRSSKEAVIKPEEDPWENTRSFDVNAKTKMQGILRVFLALSLYATAFPDNLVRGLPSSMVSVNDGLAPRRYFHFSNSNVFGSSPSAHIRMGHFRSLRHERYRHNEDGTARIVFVHPCIVNAEIDPHTMTGTD